MVHETDGGKQKAHLFYLPFSSRILRNVMIKPKSSDRSNLVEFLNTYTDKIAAQYPFWNRTNGTDHFLVACHDWVLFLPPLVTNKFYSRKKQDKAQGKQQKAGYRRTIPKTKPHN